MLSAELTAESEFADLVVVCCLKHGPSTVPGAEPKANTARKRERGVGSDKALSKIVSSLVSSTDQRRRTLSFHVEGENVGILLALTITLVRNGSNSSKLGTCVNIGDVSTSGEGDDA